ncbi:unnamed protein product [Symbiodinium sp. CCMP2456]|nr:unnamed protein product [Symbiodinium sp. CCMP2456]
MASRPEATCVLGFWLSWLCMLSLAKDFTPWLQPSSHTRSCTQMQARRFSRYSRSLRRTAGNTLRPGDRQHLLAELPGEVDQRVSDLLGHFEEAYAAPDFSPQQLKEEYNTYFRPQAASQAWQELSPRGFARLLADERLTSSSAVVDVGSGLGKLVAVAAATTPVSAAWGIELSPCRAEAAAEARKKLEALGALSSVEVERMRLLQGNCLEDLSEEALSASHFLLTMRRVGKLPAGTRQVSERFLDLLARRGDTKVVWSVGKRLEPRPGLEYVHSCMLDAEWTDQEDVLIHRYSLDSAAEAATH